MRELVKRKTLFGEPTSSDVEVLAGIQRIDDEEAELEAEAKAIADATRRRRRGDPKGVKIPIAQGNG